MGPKGELNTAILLNGHSNKIPPNFLTFVPIDCCISPPGGFNLVYKGDVSSFHGP